jgi:putative spermidine/putrescine transport system permease protein
LRTVAVATDAVVMKRSAGRRLAGLFQGRPRLQIGSLLAGPMAWLVVLYLGSLVVLLITAFWTVDPLSGSVIKELSFENFEELINVPVYREIAWRTVRTAALVTVTDAVIAFPIAFYMAKVAGRKAKAALVVAVLMPLWASYLVKIIAWRAILAEHGVLNWALSPIGLHGPGEGVTSVWLVMSYLWLPYMILPIFAGLERIPDSLISASEDLGARPVTTFRRVILPLAFPAVVAGSIFTFSLTLGDYLAPKLVSNEQFIGTSIFDSITNNQPFAAAFALVPIVVVIGYLGVARKLGAFEHV